MARFLVCFVLFCSCAVFISAEDVKFPEFKEIFDEFYQSKVQITDKNLDASAFVTEYYDSTENVGKLDIMTFGDRQTIIYIGETDEILEINSTHCLTWDTSDSQYFYYELFYDWLHKDPLIIGPSALLYFANDTRDKIVYEDEAIVRDIKCDKFTLNVTNDKDDFQIAYYFAVKGWTSPHELPAKLRVPIRIELNGVSSRESSNGSAPVLQTNDYFYFKSTIDSLSLQPPIGFGCPIRKPTVDIPKIPKVFKFAAEVVDLIQLKNKDDTDINFYQLWYDGPHKMGRLDTFKREGFASYLYDFYSGVTYAQKNGQTCSILSLMDSFFEGFDDDSGLGYFKDPQELLGLVGDFYYMGKSEVRGIKADVFEIAKTGTRFFGKDYQKLVVTVFFTTKSMEVAVDGETETQVPLYILVTGYSSPNTITLNQQINIFGFDDVVWPHMHTTFDLAKCYPEADQKSYFLLIFNADKPLATIIEGQNELFIQRLKNIICFAANITEQRLPLLKADYKTSGVYVTGLMLNRPPIMKQFFSFGVTTRTHAHEIPKPIEDAKTDEECAAACVDEHDFDCTGFYWCGKACFLKKKNPLDDRPSDQEMELGECILYFRAEKESVIRELSLPDALNKLEDAVLNQTIQVDVQINENATATPIAQDIIIGEGPYSGNKDKSFDLIFVGFEIPPDVPSSQQIDHIDTLNDCYRSCKDSDSLACSSFSYCPKATNKQCRISSVFISDTPDHKNYGDIKANTECNVYSLLYLDFYEALVGRVVVATGDKTIRPVQSTEECAKNCRTEDKFLCRGFEYCKARKSCVLHARHVLDLKAGDTERSDQTICTHYYAKFSADYNDQGIIIIDDDSNKRGEITLEECARACSEEMKTCKSFNFCPPSEPYMTDSSCSLTTLTLNDDNVPTTIKDKCHLYTKKKDVEDWGKVKPVNLADTSGYTSKAFGSLVMGMLALGLILGVLVFFGYSYYRSKSSDESMTVRFMKQADT